jgi:hypothetical protein
VTARRSCRPRLRPLAPQASHHGSTQQWPSSSLHHDDREDYLPVQGSEIPAVIMISPSRLAVARGTVTTIMRQCDGRHGPGPRPAAEPGPRQVRARKSAGGPVRAPAAADCLPIAHILSGSVRLPPARDSAFRRTRTRYHESDRHRRAARAGLTGSQRQSRPGLGD